MDRHGRTPRLAFGLLDQDGCPEEDSLTVDVLGAASRDTLCAVTTAGQEVAHRMDMKTRIAGILSQPETVQMLLLPNGRCAAAKRRIRSVPSSIGRSASVTLVVSRNPFRG